LIDAGASRRLSAPAARTIQTIAPERLEYLKADTQVRPERMIAA
jgi:hypothetical protein